MPQRRVTVVFRGILIIPQVIVLYFVGIAAAVLLVIGWFAALFTGRLPQSIADFLLGELRWRTRVLAYLYLLTDEYPPFKLSSDANYPVDIAVQSGRLNRMAILFRYFLAIPGSIAVALVSIGMYIFSVVTWVVTLVKGETPRSFFEANAATIRYTARFAAYFYMLTSFYPSEVMGDSATGPLWSPPPPSFGRPGSGPTSPTIAAPLPPPPPWAPAGAPSPSPSDSSGSLPPLAGFEPQADPAIQAPVAPGSTTPSAQPPPPQPAPPLPPPYSSGEFYAPPVGAVPQPPLQPSTSLPVDSAGTWRLVLTSGARKLVVAFFILGGLGAIAYGAVIVPVFVGTTNTVEQSATAEIQLENAVGVLGAGARSYTAAAGSCRSSDTGLTELKCLESADAQFATTLRSYSDALNSIGFPSSVQPHVRHIQSLLAVEAAVYDGFSQAGSDPQVYQAKVEAADVQVGLNRIDTADEGLSRALVTG